MLITCINDPFDECMPLQMFVSPVQVMGSVIRANWNVFMGIESMGGCVWKMEI